MDPKKRFIRWLMLCFDAKALRSAFGRVGRTPYNLTRSLPPKGASPFKIATEIVEILDRNDLFTKEVFESLAQERPGRATELWEIASLLKVEKR